MVSLNVYTWLNDSLVQSTVRDMGGPQMLTLPDSNAYFPNTYPAIFDILYAMTEGDSATVFQVVDSVMDQGIQRVFPGMKVKEIRYELTLVDQLTEAELQQKDEDARKMAEASMARKSEIEKLVNQTRDDYLAHKLGDKLQKTATGLEYVILEPGMGVTVHDGEQIATHYYGVLTASGVMFDNSFERGEPAPFRVGGLIPGFNEGMKLLRRGGKAVLFIPYNLGYGEDGTPDLNYSRKSGYDFLSGTFVGVEELRNRETEELRN